MQENMQQFIALRVEVAITELDIRMTLPVTDALLEQQKQDYQTVVAACTAVLGCVGVTIWDHTNKVRVFLLFFNGLRECSTFNWHLFSIPGPQALSITRALPFHGMRLALIRFIFA